MAFGPRKGGAVGREAGSEPSECEVPERLLGAPESTSDIA